MAKSKMEPTDEQEVVEVKRDEKGNRLVDLPGGSVATILPFKGKDFWSSFTRFKAALKAGSGNHEGLMKIIIAKCVLIDGNPVLPEELDELDGFDMMTLFGEFAEVFR